MNVNSKRSAKLNSNNKEFEFKNSEMLWIMPEDDGDNHLLNHLV